MEFIETPTFTRQILELLPDDDYRDLQNELMEDPERGDIIKGGDGNPQGTLCRQGTWQMGRESKKDNLTDKETAILRDLVKEL